MPNWGVTDATLKGAPVNLFNTKIRAMMNVAYVDWKQDNLSNNPM